MPLSLRDGAGGLGCFSQPSDIEKTAEPSVL